MRNVLEKFRKGLEEELDLDVLESKLNVGVSIPRELLFDIITPSSKLLILSYEADNSVRVSHADVKMIRDHNGELSNIIILNIPQEYRYSIVHAPYISGMLDEYSVTNMRSYLIMIAHKALHKELMG